MGPDYTYYPSGRLHERTWARGAPRLKTTYTYNGAGDLATVDYADATPDLSYTYDRRRRQATVTQGTAILTRTLDPAGNLLNESWAGGPLDGISVTNGYDEFLRRTSLVANSPTATLSSNAFSYDWIGRLDTVSDGTNSATYTYVANSSLIDHINLARNGATVMTTTKTYDSLNRLTRIATTDAQFATIASFDYQLNSANQRTAITNAENARWVYQYDSLGQVVSGKKYWPDGSVVAGQQFEYRFDDIGNRKSAASGGNDWGNNLRYQFYSANSLNQYSNRTVSGYVTVNGSANSAATVTLWGPVRSHAPTLRKGDYYSGELFLPTTVPLWASITNMAVLQDSPNPDILTNFSGCVYSPQNPEMFGYDLDGNLTNDGRWSYTWDAENRLVKMEPSGTVAVPDDAKAKLEFTYDPQGRRIQKATCLWTNSAWLLVLSNRFAYDDWNLIAELNATNNTLIRSYAWGTDLSGTLHGAGGVGGLLFLTDTLTLNKEPSTYFVAFDANGNVAALVNADGSGISAAYEYGPFGEVLRATGPMARGNPFRFSTKYQDNETDLLYYGQRFYSANFARWTTRDPIGTSAGLNEYSFLGNSPVFLIDPVGLCASCRCKPIDIKFDPGNQTFKWDITHWPNAKEKLGNNIEITMPVEGERTACQYEQDERGMSFEEGHAQDLDRIHLYPGKGELLKIDPKTQMNAENTYVDRLGLFLLEAAYYEYVLQGKIVWKCTGSDGYTKTKTLELEGLAIAKVPSSGAPSILTQKITKFKLY